MQEGPLPGLDEAEPGPAQQELPFDLDDFDAAAREEDLPGEPAGEEPADAAVPVDVDTLRRALAEQEAALERRDAENRALLERLRLALLEAEPAVAPELVRAASIAELESSFAEARAVVERIRQEVLREVAASVPAGAPPRTAVRPASAIDLIRAGLRQAG